MAKAVINLQKESGGIVKISPVDGIGVTELVVPESGELVTKDYADLKVALASFIGTNQILATNGYQKLPGGLIVQWGNVESGLIANGTINVNYPIVFPNRALSGTLSPKGVSTFSISSNIFSKDYVGIRCDAAAPVAVTYIAIGY